MAETLICSIDGCNKPASRKGWCIAHYTKWRRHGNPTASRHDRDLIHWLRANFEFDGDACLEWPFATNDGGYGYLQFKGRSHPAHRVMCILAYGEPPIPDAEAAHSCGNRLCCNPCHIRWATHAENEADKIHHGTVARGETAGNVILSEAQVREIRSLKGVMSQRVIAKQFGVSQPTIGAIMVGRNWGWLP